MELDTVIETPGGGVKYTGTLEGEELLFVIQTGLRYLMMKGAITPDEDEVQH